MSQFTYYLVKIKLSLIQGIHYMRNLRVIRMYLKAALKKNSFGIIHFKYIFKVQLEKKGF